MKSEDTRKRDSELTSPINAEFMQHSETNSLGHGGCRMRTIANFIAFIPICLLLAGCDFFESPAVIKGIVKDNFGKPVDGVKVSIENTEFAAVTKSDGTFELTFIPGAFKIIFADEAHIGHIVDLDIRERAIYPLASVALVKIPPKGGVFLVGSSDYIPLSEATVMLLGEGQESRFIVTSGEKWNTTSKLISLEYSGLLSKLSENKDSVEIPFVDTDIEYAMPFWLDRNEIAIKVDKFLMSYTMEVVPHPEKLQKINDFYFRTIHFSRKSFNRGINLCFAKTGNNISGRMMVDGKNSRAYCFSSSMEAATEIFDLSPKN